MYDVIDVPMDVSAYADDIARRGVKTVIRYYNHRNSRRLPTKRIELAEAQALQSAGLSQCSVFQQRGGAGGHIEDLDHQSGLADAIRAVQLARALGQPAGSAIYFAVDHDYYRASEIRNIMPYFDAIRATIGGDFKVGVYGSGTVGEAAVSAGFADLIWLAGAVGWSGTRDMLRTDKWAIFQKYLHKTWPGGAFGYDGNIVSPANPNFGQFNLDGTDADNRAPALNLMEVIARSGLKLRTGPGLQYTDVTTIPSQTVVAVIGRSGDWVQVDLEGDGRADGFMHRDFLQPVTGGFPIDRLHRYPIEVARSELSLGVREIGGSEHNPRIVMYHATTSGGASSDETAWCSSFVNHCVEQVGLRGTDSKWAMSWHDSRWGSEATNNPQDGDIVVFKRRARTRTGEVVGGHVGFWTEAGDGEIRVLGGNQGNAVSHSHYPIDGVKGRYHYELLSIRRP